MLNDWRRLCLAMTLVRDRSWVLLRFVGGTCCLHGDALWDDVRFAGGVRCLRNWSYHQICAHNGIIYTYWV